MSTHRHKPPAPLSRRAFLQLGGLAGAGLVPGLLALSPSARALSLNPYRALVCVYLSGGNDGNNMVVPTDTAGYAQYLRSRGGAVGTAANAALALPNAGEPGGVLPLKGTRYGLHPSMGALRQLWDQGNMALLFNVGNLVQPFAAKADFIGNTDASLVPENLFSHIDQSHLALMSSAGLANNTGWAGRLADFVPAPDSGVPAAISAAGNTLYLAGSGSSQLVVPQSGAMNFNFFSADAPSQARLSALQSLLAKPDDSALVAALGASQADVLRKAGMLQSVLGGPAAVSMASYFPDVANSALAQQLIQVALLIQAAVSGTLAAPAQQIFYVELGGFDTHDAQLSQHAALLAELSAALSNFFQAMVGIGLSDNVVAFTMSDFGRTMQPTSNGGSDHGWGSHHLVVGGTGAVRSGTYGTFPDLALGGDSDVDQRGRWLPSTGIEQYGATLATWLGAGRDAQAAAFPNLGRFATANLGFLA